MVGKWKHCHGILDAPQKSDLHSIDAVMVYVMEFMASGGLLRLVWQDLPDFSAPVSQQQTAFLRMMNFEKDDLMR